MSSSQQIVHTICFHTSDAVNREEGKFTFLMPGDSPRLKAVKLMLGSLEFPVTQYTVEREWNRLYFCEGVQVNSKSRSLHLRITSQSIDDRRDVFINLPIRVNPIIKWRVDRDRGMMIVTCQFPHGLWSNDTSHCVVRDIWWDSVLLIGCPLGTLSLSSENDLYYVTSTEFGITATEERIETLAAGLNDIAPRAGYLYVPDLPSPHELCECLTACARGMHDDVAIAFRFSARDNKVDMTVRSVSYTHRVVLVTTSLSMRMGLGSMDREEKVSPEQPCRLESQQTALWSAVGLAPGWYGPSHRPMLSGQPKSFMAEMEHSLNRMSFPLPERVADGSMTAYYLVFIDPSGQTLFCPVPTGKYTPAQLCSILEQGMTVLSIASTPGVSYSVFFEQHRFVFACEVRDQSDHVQPANFALVLNHPQQFDPEKIGFSPLLYTGSASYTSIAECTYVSAETVDDADMLAFNSYRFSDVSHQERFRLHASPAYAMTGVILNYLPQDSALLVKTYVGQLPYSHGLVAGDVVQLQTVSNTEVFVSGDDGWVEKSVSPCPISSMWNRYAVVLQVNKTSDLYPTTLLKLRVRPNNELADCTGQAIGIQPPTRPFNICVGTHGDSIRPHMLGVSQGALQWGRDGSCHTLDRTHRVAPFVFPFIHNLDHPDYILMHFEDGKRGTLLQHHYGNMSSTPFAKIVLYPMLREERMLPRDTTMISGENMSTFTVKFTNPDGSPYKFHGAQFSFSLNFVKIQD